MQEWCNNKTVGWGWGDGRSTGSALLLVARVADVRLDLLVVRAAVAAHVVAARVAPVARLQQEEELGETAHAALRGRACRRRGCSRPVQYSLPRYVIRHNMN